MNIVILSNGNANYSTKRLVEEAESRGHSVRVIKYKNCYAAMEQSNPANSHREIALYCAAASGSRF